MHARRTVTLLAQDKAMLRERIAARRRANVIAAGRVLEPLRWVDDGIRTWQKIPPAARSATGPSVLLLLMWVLPCVGKVLGWAPVLRGVWRAFRASRKQAAA
jgi:hypothetical protein